MIKSSLYTLYIIVLPFDIHMLSNKYPTNPSGTRAPWEWLAEGAGMPATLTVRTKAGAVNWKEAWRAPDVKEQAVNDAAALLKKIATGFGKAETLRARTRALAGARASRYEATLRLLDTPQFLAKLLEKRAIKKITAAPMLAFANLALPKLDHKIQSEYTRVRNHGLTYGRTVDQFGEAVRTLGVVELKKRETDRRAAFRGKSARPTGAEYVKRVRNGRRTLAVDGIPLPEGSEMALLIVGRINDQLRVRVRRRAQAADGGNPAGRYRWRRAAGRWRPIGC